MVFSYLLVINDEVSFFFWSHFFFAASQEVVSFLKRMSPGHIAACSMSPACVRQASLALRMIAGEDGTSKGIFFSNFFSSIGGFM